MWHGGVERDRESMRRERMIIREWVEKVRVLKNSQVVWGWLGLRREVIF